MGNLRADVDDNSEEIDDIRSNSNLNRENIFKLDKNVREASAYSVKNRENILLIDQNVRDVSSYSTENRTVFLKSYEEGRSGKFSFFVVIITHHVNPIF